MKKSPSNPTPSHRPEVRPSSVPLLAAGVEVPASRPLGSLPTESGPAPAGRPSTFSPVAVKILCEIIRELGLSDSAAAELAGFSTSSLSRWKHQHPEFRIELARARAEFHEAKLNLILAAASDPRGGWRAAAWILERTFPEEYCPRAAEREKFQRLAATRAAREEAYFAEAEALSASETPSQYSRNSPAAPPSPVDGDPGRERDSASESVAPSDPLGALPPGAALPNPASFPGTGLSFGTPSRNSRNLPPGTSPQSVVVLSSGIVPPAL